MAVEAPGTHSAVTGAIRHASRLTGTNFQYLVATAQVESKFNPAAAAATSSARGLFQFIEQTWLATLKEQGPALGYAQVADAIERAPSGQYVVTDPRLSDRILKLRNDPTVNAVMAGAYTRANAGKLAGRLGRNPTEGELYVAHFLGSNGASRLISLAESKPGTRADEAFPGPARANPAIFYDRGRPRSVARGLSLAGQSLRGCAQRTGGAARHANRCSPAAAGGDADRRQRRVRRSRPTRRCSPMPTPRPRGCPSRRDRSPTRRRCFTACSAPARAAKRSRRW